MQPSTDLLFRWGTLTRDFLGHSLEPLSGIDSVNITLWNLTPDELSVKLREDDLRAIDLKMVMSFYTENERSEATLFEFTSVGSPLTPEDILPYFDTESFPADEHSYTVSVVRGVDLSGGDRMIQAFTLDPASTNALVEVTDASTLLEYSVDLQALQPTLVPLGNGNVTIDWTNLEVNALGHPFYSDSISEVVVARYGEGVAELENQFLDLELIAEEMWRGDVATGTTAELSSLTNAAGKPFSGIDEAGTWLVALICGGCRHPAPWYLSFLTPCSPGG